MEEEGEVGGGLGFVRRLVPVSRRLGQCELGSDRCKRPSGASKTESEGRPQGFGWEKVVTSLKNRPFHKLVSKGNLGCVLRRCAMLHQLSFDALTGYLREQRRHCISNHIADLLHVLGREIEILRKSLNQRRFAN